MKNLILCARIFVLLCFFSCSTKDVSMKEQFSEDDFQIIEWRISVYQFYPDIIGKHSLADEVKFPRKTYSLKNIKTYYWDEQIIEFMPEVRQMGYGEYISLVFKGEIIFTSYSITPEISLAPKVQQGVHYSIAFWPYLIITPYEDIKHIKTFKDYPNESKVVLQNPELYEYLKRAKKITEGHFDLNKLFDTEKIYYGRSFLQYR